MHPMLPNLECGNECSKGLKMTALTTRR